MLGRDVYDIPKRTKKVKEHPGYDDIFGRRMKVGDIIAYSPVGKLKRLGVGEVIGFTPKMVRVKTGPDYMSNGVAYPQNITRYAALCVLKHDPKSHLVHPLNALLQP